jgi:hypothetical protein
VVALEALQELLAQPLLGVAAARSQQLRRGAGAQANRARRGLLGPVTYPSSRILRSTTLLRATAPSGFLHGDKAPGARMGRPERGLGQE